MKIKKIIPLIVAMLLTSTLAQASNIIRVQAPIVGGHPSEQSGNWLPWESVVSDWTNAGEATGCSNWNPLVSDIAFGITFTQTATDCQQAQQRTVQATERNDKTLAIRNAGSPVTESQTTSATKTQTATGTSTISDTAQYLVTVGNISSQWGYMTNASIGTMISNSNPKYVLNYVSLGFGNNVLIGLVGQTQNSASKYDSIKIQMLNSAGEVFYTMSSNAIANVYGPAPYYIGWAHNATDYANAKIAKRFIVTLNFK